MYTYIACTCTYKYEVRLCTCTCKYELHLCTCTMYITCTVPEFIKFTYYDGSSTLIS